MAFHLLTRWRWQSDIQRDAEDIAAESTRILLGQEASGRGLFGTKPGTESQLRGYLSRTIWRSCTQIALRMRSRMHCFSLDALLEAGRDFESSHTRPPQESQAEFNEIVSRLKESRSRYRKLPDGVDPLDCLLAFELGDGTLPGVKRRTLQRYAKQIRSAIQSHRDLRRDKT